MRRSLSSILWTVTALASPGASAQSPHAKAQGYVYESRIDEQSDGVLELGNDAVVRTPAYLGAVERSQEAILFILGSGCRIWVEGRGVYRCEVLRNPSDEAPTTPAMLIWIERIARDGALLHLAGGSVLEVLDQKHVTNVWRPGEALLIGDSRVLPREGSEEVVNVVRMH